MTLFMQDIYFIIYKDIIIFNIHLYLISESIIKRVIWTKIFCKKTKSYKIVIIMKIFIKPKHYS